MVIFPFQKSLTFHFNKVNKVSLGSISVSKLKSYLCKVVVDSNFLKYIKKRYAMLENLLDCLALWNLILILYRTGKK